MTKREKVYAGSLVLVVLASAAVIWLAWTMPEPTGDVEGPTADQSKGEAEIGLIRGVVVDFAGDPIVGATVSAGEHEQASDAEGRFTFEDLDPGIWRVDAAAQGYISPGPVAQRGLEVTLGDGEGSAPRFVTGLRLVLRRPGELRGKVVAAGRPISGAHIDLAWIWSEGLQGSIEPYDIRSLATSDEKGSFVLKGVAPGRLRIAAHAPGHPSGRSGEINLQGGQKLKGIVIDLQPLGRILGQVTGDSKPVVAELHLSCATMRRPLRVRSGPNGRFVFEDVPEGRCVLTASAPGYLTDEQPVLPKAGGETRVNLRLRQAKGVVGRVLDAEERPVLGAWVILSAGEKELRTRTGHSGEFSISTQGLSLRGATALAVSARHSASAERPVMPGEPLVLHLGPGGWITGTVVDGAGRPQPGALITMDSVQVDPPNPISRPRVMPARSEGSGAFRLGPLRPGTYDLRAERMGQAAGFARGIAVASGAVQSGVRIVLAGGATLSGRITARDTGDAVSGAVIALYEPGSFMPPRRARTDREGRYTLSGLSSGMRSVRVQHPRYLTELSSGVSIPEEGEVTRDVALAIRKPGERFRFQGIGASLGQTSRGVIIRKIMKDSPASRFGLKNGDLVLGVDFKSIQGKSISQVVELIRGQAGKPVSLDIDRAGSGRMTISVERGQVVVKDK